MRVDADRRGTALRRAPELPLKESVDADGKGQYDCVCVVAVVDRRYVAAADAAPSR
jgi:hypothetical protein